MGRHRGNNDTRFKAEPQVKDDGGREYKPSSDIAENGYRTIDSRKTGEFDDVERPGTCPDAHYRRRW